MNYERLYNSIIENSKGRELSGYQERHHIIPKSRGGSNDASNIAILTAREHLICHILLARIYGGKMWAAINRMTNFGEKNSRKYEIFRRGYSRSISGKGNPRYGVSISQETRDAIGRGNKGKIPTILTRQKISKASKGKKNSEITKIRKSRSRGGRSFKVFKLTGDQRGKRSVNLEGKVYIGTFHSQRECSRVLKINHQNMHKFFRGLRPHIGGYVFEVIDGDI